MRPLKNLILILLIAVLLAGCTTASNNSDDDTRSWSKDKITTTTKTSTTFSHNKLIEVNVDSHDTTNVEISTCPKALAVGVGSCNVEVP